MAFMRRRLLGLQRELLPNVLLLLTVLLLCLFVGESMLKFFFLIFPAVLQPDKVLLYKLVPHAKKIFIRNKRNGGQRIFVSINSRGFRGEEFSDSVTKKRIIVYDDSFIEAEFSSNENTFVKRLENDLNRNCHGCTEVI